MKAFLIPSHSILSEESFHGFSGHLASELCTVLGCDSSIGLYRPGAKAQLGAEQTATTTGGINEETGANITGIPSQWNLTNPDPGSGPLAPLNATVSSEL